ncbi:NHL domain-containing protein [Butyrivibrio sp. LC3010]|uniref:NHL domain-containing protein n=1 Tax=Butyrivibrio sp. LC3010 TaxID=1280680 RepID=UPI000424CA44|nr:hypothetical protein [Butyrivibrio sp. LC3010]
MKKKKNGLKWLVLVLVLLVTAFTGSMVACGLFKERNSDKSADKAEESEEIPYDAEITSLEQGDGINSIANGYAAEFALEELPDTIEPCGMCVYDDVLYVTDTFSKCIWKVTGSSAEIYAGAESSRDIYDKPQGGYNDADATEALFKMPWAIAPFMGGMAVTDTDNNSLRIINAGKVDTLNSSEDGSVYDYPTGISADDGGNLYIADTHSDDVKIVFSDGSVGTFAEGIDSPMGLFWKAGYLYVAETGKNRIVKVSTSDLSVPKSKNDLEVVAGSGEEGFDDGNALGATFSSPKGLAVGDDGTVYVADTVNGAVRCIKNGQVKSLEIKDSLSPDAELVSPIGICIYGGRLYVADNFGRRIYSISI